jgi:RNA polymerase sigma-70 factor, ECF subfamily
MHTLADVSPAPAAAETTELTRQIAALRPTLVRMARQRLRNDAWAEDAVSETVIAAIEAQRSFQHQSQLQTWLVGILKHKIVDQIRRHTRERQLETFDDEIGSGAFEGTDPAQADEAAADWGDPMELFSRRQFMTLLDAGLKSLPPQQSRAFVLRNLREEDTESICRQMGVTSNHLWVILHRARAQLRASLQPHWFPTPRGMHAAAQG